jgi:transposase-like protein
MSLVSFRCPSTARDVETAIDTDKAALARMRYLKVSVSCPYCPKGHSVPADEMFFAREMTSAPA